VAHRSLDRHRPAEPGTRLRHAAAGQVALSYNPVAGAAGHAAATVLGSNPKKQLDEDLLRMKSLLETGKEPHDAAVRRPIRAKS
jgi:uncharacterized membrane protein